MNIRKAVMSDVRGIHHIVNQFAEENLMLARSLNDIYEFIRDYWVAEKDSEILGCCALHISWEDLAEIKSLAVVKELQKKGVGRQLVQACLSEVRTLGIQRVFALTYQPEFFKHIGFKQIEKEKLPHKIWTECIKCYKFPDCDETAMEISVNEKK